MKKATSGNIKSPNKFVIFNHSGAIGGGERSSLILLENLDRKKYDPLFLFPKGSYESLVRETKVRYEALNIYLMRIRTLPLYILSIINLFFKLKKENPRFIYCNSIQSSHWGAPLGFLLKKPVVVHFRDWNIGFGSTIILKLFPNYFAIANSNAVRDKMLKEGFMKKNRSFTVYNAVDTNKFYPDRKDQRLKIEFGLSDKEFLIGIIGRIDPWKGHLDLIEAAKILKKKETNFQILIVGDTSWTKNKNYIDAIKRKVQKYRLEERVVFTGFQKDVPKVLHSLDLVVIPSRNEPFGRLAIEGMAVGVPVLGADSGGLLELLKGRKLGLLFKTGDIQDLAAKIIYIYEKRPMLKSVVSTEAERIKKDFLPEIYSDKIQNIFGRLLEHENN